MTMFADRSPIALFSGKPTLCPLIGRGIRHEPAPAQPMLAVDRDMVLIAERWDRDVDRRQRAIRLGLGLGELHCPACFTILVPELGRPILSGTGNAAGLDLVLLLLR